MLYPYFIVDRQKTNVVLFLTFSNQWVNENYKHQALRFQNKLKAQKILDAYLKKNKIINKWNLYRIEQFMVAE